MNNVKQPPYAKALIARLAYGNPPEKVIVTVGAGAWESAKHWNKKPDYSALVLPADTLPDQLHWPVNACVCQIEWDAAAPAELIILLVQALHSAGAAQIIVWPIGVDCKLPAWLLNTATQQWEQVREQIHVYGGQQ